MSNYAIPIQRDGRTFEQRRHDTLRNTGETTSTRTTSSTQSSGLSSKRGRGNRLLPDTDFGDWDSQIDEWVSLNKMDMDEAIKRQRQRMLTLLPRDDILDRSFHSDAMDGFGRNGSSRLGWDMDDLRGRMGSMSMANDPMFRNRKNMFSSSSEETTTTRSFTSTRSSGNDPKNMMTKTDVQESSSSSVTRDGVTTGSSSHSSSSTTATGADAAKKKILSTVPGGDLSISTGASGDLLKNMYEINERGHLTVQIDASDFKPEDIEVTTENNELRVQAKVEKSEGSSKSVKEFCRTLKLPSEIDHGKIQCHLTTEGVLSIELPVEPPQYSSVQWTDAKPVSGPLPPSSLSRQGNQSELRIMGNDRPEIVNDSGGRKLHIEIPVKADFRAEDLLVKVDRGRLIVTGGVAKGEGKTEFTRTYDVPDDFDPALVNAQLSGNILVIEATLRS